MALLGTAVPGNGVVDGSGSARRTLHNDVLPCTEDFDQAFICSPNRLAKFQGLSYLYRFFTNFDVFKLLGELFSSFFSWDTRAQRAFCSASNNTPTTSFSPAAHISDAGAGKVRDEEIVEVPVDSVDENLHGKKVLVLLFDPKMYSCKEVSHVTSQVDEVSKQLRAVSRKHEVG